jgi:hypothetical protein
MKKTILINTIGITIGIIAAVGISYVSAAGVFNAPTSTAPNGNIEVPIHAGFDQIKDGGLSVGAFSAYGNAYFDQNTIFTGNVYGGAPGDPTSTVRFGGVSNKVGMTATGNVGSTGTIASASLSSGGGLVSVCADTTGKFTLCPQNTALINPSGSGYIVGNTNNGIVINNPTITVVTGSNNPAIAAVSSSSVYRAGNPLGSPSSLTGYQIGPNVVAGNVYTLSGSVVMGNANFVDVTTSVTAVKGDTPSTIASKLAAAINTTIAAKTPGNDVVTAGKYPVLAPPVYYIVAVGDTIGSYLLGQNHGAAGRGGTAFTFSVSK